MAFEEGRIYRYLQNTCAYESLALEGFSLGKDEVKDLYEHARKPDDEISHLIYNHFLCFDYMIYHVDDVLNEDMICNMHYLLTKDDEQRESGILMDQEKMQRLLKALLSRLDRDDLQTENLLDFYVRFMRLHPFASQNGPVGRLLLFKECLRHQKMPFIIRNDEKYMYYRGMMNWNKSHEMLLELAYYEQKRLRRLVKKQSVVAPKFSESSSKVVRYV